MKYGVLIVLAILLATTTTALAGEQDPTLQSEQGIGGALGISTGGRSTPGGLRIAGSYLYQLSSDDWFDGVAAFTLGGGGAACFRDRSKQFVCDHSLASGAAVTIEAGVRRYFAARGEFTPFARVGVGLAIVSFRGDDVTGLAVPIHLGAGLRVAVVESIAITAQAALEIGIARFGHDLGTEPQLGAFVTIGAELEL